MSIWQVDRSGTEFDMFGRGRNPGKEGNARCDVLGLIGNMLTDICLGESQLVGEQEGFAIFFQREPPIFPERVDRHCKETELHCLQSSRASRSIGPCVVRSLKTSAKFCCPKLSPDKQT